MALLAGLFSLALVTCNPTQVHAAEARDAALKASQGRAALVRGQYREADSLLTEALRSVALAEATRVFSLNNRALARWRLHDLRAAVSDFNAALKLAPAEPTLYNNRGNVLLELKLYDEAEKDFDQAIALAPSYGAAHHNRGNALFLLGKHAEAIAEFSKAVTLLPQNPAPLNGRGKAQAALQRPAGAVRDFSRAIALNGRYGEAYGNRAEAMVVLRRYRDAIDDYTSALTFGAKTARVYLGRASVYRRLNKPGLALEDVAEARSLDPSLAADGIEPGPEDDADAIETAAAPVEDRKRLCEDGDTAQASGRSLAKLADATGAGLKNALLVQAKSEVGVALAPRDGVKAEPARSSSPCSPEDAVADDDEETPFVGPEVNDWAVDVTPNGYVARHLEHTAIKLTLEMYGNGEPELLHWQRLKGSLRAIGLLHYYAGASPNGERLEYVALINVYSGKLIAIEPCRWGDQLASWAWSDTSVVVVDPQGVRARSRSLSAPSPPQRGHERRRPAGRSASLPSGTGRHNGRGRASIPMDAGSIRTASAPGPITEPLTPTLERLQPEPGAMVLGRRLARFGIEATVIELLPFLRLGAGARLLQIGVELRAARGPGIVLAFELGVLRQEPQFRLDGFHRAKLHRKDVAIRLALFEPHADFRLGEDPVHGEAVGRPIGLDDAGKSGDAVLRPVDRSLHHQARAGFGAKQARKVEGQNAVAEMAHGRRLRAGIGLDGDRVGRAPAVPGGEETGVAQDLPAKGIGDVERQAAIGEALIGLIHPLALDGRRADIDVMTVENMRDQLHSGSGSEEDRADKVAVEQDLPSQHVFVADGLGQDDATIGDHRKHVGKIVEADLGARRIARGNQLETLLEPLAPIQNRRGIEVPDLLVEQAILVAIGGDEASRVAAREVGHHFRQHLKSDEEAMERILVELIGAGKQLVEQSVLARHVTDQKRLRQLALVPEMIEKAALGNADRRDQLLDRGRGEALLSTDVSATSRRRSRVSLPFRGVSCIPMLSLRRSTVPRVQLKMPRRHTSRQTRHPGLVPGSHACTASLLDSSPNSAHFPSQVSATGDDHGSTGKIPRAPAATRRQAVSYRWRAGDNPRVS